MVNIQKVVEKIDKLAYPPQIRLEERRGDVWKSNDIDWYPDEIIAGVIVYEIVKSRVYKSHSYALYEIKVPVIKV